jgi:hypothetical protein
VGKHCHACGQKAHLHRTIGAFFHDLLHGVFHFEGKIWRTLPMLAWRPGELTRRYIHGDRVRFVSPLALFLFSAFALFAVFAFTGNTLIGLGTARTPEQVREIAEIDRTIEELQRRREISIARGENIADLELDLRRADAARAAASILNGQPTQEPISFRTGWKRLDKGIEKAGKNPQLLFYKLQSSAYKFSWALIPLSLPFVGLLFLNRRRYRRIYGAYDHVVFITYSISFMTLLVIFLSILFALGMPAIMFTAATLAVPPLHIFRQLRGAYMLPWWSAGWRTAAIMLFALATSGLFLIGLLAMGLLG